METAIAELVRALLAHSECIALFILVVFQQLVMHQINVRKLTSLRNALRSVQQKLIDEGKDDAANGR